MSFAKVQDSLARLQERGEHVYWPERSGKYHALHALVRTDCGLELGPGFTAPSAAVAAERGKLPCRRCYRDAP